MAVSNPQNVFILHNQKFKSDIYSFKFILDYDQKIKIALEIFKVMLARKTINYPSINALRMAKDLLYGLSCYTQSQVLGMKIILHVNFVFLNPKYTDITYEDYHALIKEMLLNSIFDEHSFNEAQAIACDKVSRRLEQPNIQAYYNALSHIKDFDNICKYNLCSSKEVKTISYNDFLVLKDQIFNDAEIKLYCNTNCQKEKLLSFFQTLNFEDKTKKLEFINTYVKPNIEKIDELQNNQSVIYTFYNTPYNLKHPDKTKWLVAQALFSKGINSLCFSEIREKYGLCYSIYGSELSDIGLCYVTALINHDSYEQFKELLKVQIDNLITQNYDADLLENTKKMLITDVLSQQDTQYEIINAYFTNDILNKTLDFDTLVYQIEAVNKDDITEIFKNYVVAYTYFLKGVTNV